jgi:hypothetical protein
VLSEAALEHVKDGDPHDMAFFLASLWGIPSAALARTRRPCYSCLCTLLRCHPQRITTDVSDAPDDIIEIEFLGMALTTNHIMPNYTFCNVHRASNATYQKLCAAKSEHELIFEHYLPTRKPDMVVISTTGSHDCEHSECNTPKVLNIYRELKSSIAALRPQAAMWITTVSQRQNMSMNPRVKTFNTALFPILKKELVRRAKTPTLTLAAFDNLALTIPISKYKWPWDPIHFHPMYYTDAMTHLFNLWLTSY